MIQRLKYPNEISKDLIVNSLRNNIDILVKQKVWDSVSFTNWCRENLDSETRKLLYDKAIVIKNDLSALEKLKYKLKDAIFIID